MKKEERSEQALYKCDECGRGYSARKNLNKHLRKGRCEPEAPKLVPIKKTLGKRSKTEAKKKKEEEEKEAKKQLKELAK